MEQQLLAVQEELREGHAGKALALLQRLRELPGGRPNWRLLELIAEGCKQLGDAEGAAAALYQAAQEDEYLRSQREHYSGYLFALHYLPSLSPEELARAHFAYGELCRGEGLAEARKAAGSGQGAAGKKRLRVGYLAPSFCESAVLRFAEPLLGLDPEHFEVRAYALDAAEDETSRRLGQRVKLVSLAGLSTEEAAGRIGGETLDILVDLGGHSGGGRTLFLLPYRLAPVQLAGIGYFDTWGLPPGWVQGLLADGSLVRPGEEGRFTENLWRLPQALAFQPTEELRQAREQARAGREAGEGGEGLSFGVFQNFLKVTEAALAAWGEILRAVPGSRLLLQDTLPLSERAGAIRQRAALAGLPLERVEIRMGQRDFLRDYGRLDLVLDTFPYPGGYMTALALYLGVPVVTLAGDRYGSRLGESLLRAAHRREWVGTSVEEYVEKAVKLAGSARRLRREQRRLYEDLPHSALLDTDSYVRSVEESFIGMRCKRCSRI